MSDDEVPVIAVVFAVEERPRISFANSGFDVGRDGARLLVWLERWPRWQRVMLDALAIAEDDHDAEEAA
jgi:hypothetical protein